MTTLHKNTQYKNSLKKWYKSLSAKGLSLIVKPDVLGDTPVITETATFYVLDEYSRANSLLLESQTQSSGLPNALQSVQTQGIDESSAMIFLKHRRADKRQKVSPRLLRLIKACLADKTLSVKLVPTTIFWGRAPDKEESLLKLLMADEWRVPSISKQLFNIGVLGRDSFVQFFDTKDLQTLIADAQTQLADRPNNVSFDARAEQIAMVIEARIKGYLTKQRTSILGPDMSDRRNIAGSVLNSPQVQSAIEDKARSTSKSIPALKKEAKHYIDEIASDYSHSVVRVFDHFLTWLWTQLYDGVEVRHFERVRTLAPDHQIIYVPCHRSHMDYLLLSYVIYTRGLRIPYVAAGSNLNIPMLGEILRSGGAFFLRRSFKDNPLYGAVFKEYFYSLMQRNTPIEYFVEGGRSRSGRLLAPKLGMLAMTVQSYLRKPAKPVVFIPTYISYERIMEGATYIGELKGKPKESENLLGVIKTARKIERIFGTVHLSFGEPLYLDNFLTKFDVANPRLIDDNAPNTDNTKQD
ncbi:MAG: glycerol-3-phosphate 1-O-acyltransferase PlsB, partial [Moraxella sp.]|nr:glycerol-3-phosphate 1-O-acyltransferase PlsB [Moraxella sp.]